MMILQLSGQKSRRFLHTVSFYDNNKYSPFLAAKIPPVAAPLIIEFHGSSFFRKWTNVQSIVLNIPPQTAKFPAIIGERCFIAAKLPSYNDNIVWKYELRIRIGHFHTIRRLKPDGAFRKPFIAWNIPPPIHPIAKAPPQSSTIRYGHGSRAYSSIVLVVVIWNYNKLQ